MTSQGSTFVVATIMGRTAPEIDMAIEEVTRLGADAAEVRFDVAPGVEPEEIGAGSVLPLIATCRSRRDGGHFDAGEDERVRLLERAEGTGRFRLDVERGSAAERIQQERPGAVAMVSRHDHEGTPADLDGLARDLLDATRPGQIAKLVTTARSGSDILRVREVLSRHRELGSQERRAAQVVASGNGHPGTGHGRLAALAMGDAGVASRILAGVWGSAVMWASAFSEAPAAPGQVPLETLLGLYRFRALGPQTRLYAVAGRPIGRSLSPVLHNTAFAHQGLDAVYVPLECASADELATLAVALPLEGVSVTAPLKVAVLPWVTDADGAVARAGACNTLVFERGRDEAPQGDGEESPAGGEAREGTRRSPFTGVVRGFNTDGPAALDEIRAHVTIEGRPAVVVGAGGAARAIADALATAGARVRIANRGQERGEALARDLGVPFLPIGDIDEGPDRILVQATSAPLEDPVVPERARRAAFVLDVRYGEVDGALVTSARRAGTPAANGLGMLVRQAAAQIRLFTGGDVPLDVLFETVRPARRSP